MSEAVFKKRRGRSQRKEMYIMDGSLRIFCILLVLFLHVLREKFIEDVQAYLSKIFSLNAVLRIKSFNPSCSAKAKKVSRRFFLLA